MSKNYAKFCIINGQKKKERVLFTAEDERKLWQFINVPFVDTILLLMYTRLWMSEMLTIPRDKVNLELGVIQHGGKTEAGKSRIVPIPEKIRFIVEKYYSQGKSTLVTKSGKRMRDDYYRRHVFKPILRQLQLNDKLTIHSTRHYYASFLNKTVSNKTTTKNLLGHIDYAVTANIYTHQDVQELITAVKNL